MVLEVLHDSQSMVLSRLEQSIQLTCMREFACKSKSKGSDCFVNGGGGSEKEVFLAGWTRVFQRTLVSDSPSWTRWKVGWCSSTAYKRSSRKHLNWKDAVEVDSMVELIVCTMFRRKVEDRAAALLLQKASSAP